MGLVVSTSINILSTSESKLVFVRDEPVLMAIVQVKKEKVVLHFVSIQVPQRTVDGLGLLAETVFLNLCNNTKVTVAEALNADQSMVNVTWSTYQGGGSGAILVHADLALKPTDVGYVAGVEHLITQMLEKGFPGWGFDLSNHYTQVRVTARRFEDVSWNRINIA